VDGARGEEDRGEHGPAAAEAAASPGRLVLERSEETRAALCDAALEVAGEIGWRRLSVEAIASRAGVSRARFYRLFADRDECLAAAHRRRAASLLEDLPTSPDRAGARLALSRLAELIEAEPLLARGLLAEARLADGAVSASLKEVSERLSGAVHGACRETSKPRHSPPPIAAPLILAALDSAVVEAVTAPRAGRFADRVPALVVLACHARRSPGA
jgi:AcrR family transcriptional regulator